MLKLNKQKEQQERATADSSSRDEIAMETQEATGDASAQANRSKTRRTSRPPTSKRRAHKKRKARDTPAP